MNRVLLTAVVALLGLAPLRAHAQEGNGDQWDDQTAQANAQSTFDTFQENLSPYGQWEQDGSYGQVFYPNVAPNWRPYTYGQWEMTDYGWTWVSDEPFGWATFHYGRWWWNGYRHAWAWVPGYEWAPAWVVWRYGPSSVGWSPLSVGYDYWVDGYPVVYDQWVYVPCEHFYGGPVNSYVYPTNYVRTTFYSTTVVNGYVGTASYGPPQQFVQAHSAQPIHPIQIIHAASPAAAAAEHGNRGEHLAVFIPKTATVYHPDHLVHPAMRGAGAAPMPPNAFHPTPAPQPGHVATARPTATEPAHNEPNHTEPAHNEPAHNEPARPTESRAAPASYNAYHPQELSNAFHPTQNYARPAPQPPQNNRFEGATRPAAGEHELTRPAAPAAQAQPARRPPPQPEPAPRPAQKKK